MISGTIPPPIIDLILLRRRDNADSSADEHEGGVNGEGIVCQTRLSMAANGTTAFRSMT